MLALAGGCAGGPPRMAEPAQEASETLEAVREAENQEKRKAMFLLTPS